jgi:uncharacterized OsmC-like protein
LTADVKGDIAEVEGVLKISRIHLEYRLKTPSDTHPKIEKILGVYADSCPAYQSVKSGIDCTWKVIFES